jgi:hypothetical protein
MLDSSDLQSTWLISMRIIDELFHRQLDKGFPKLTVEHLMIQYTRRRLTLFAQPCDAVLIFPGGELCWSAPYSGRTPGPNPIAKVRLRRPRRAWP